MRSRNLVSRLNWISTCRLFGELLDTNHKRKPIRGNRRQEQQKRLEVVKMSSMGKNEPFSIPSYERTLLKPPYELLLSNFRSDQKAVEKEIAQLTNFMAVKLPTMGLSLKDTIRTMEKLSARLEKLKQTVLQADERSIQSLGTLAFRRKVLKRTGTRQGMPRREDMMVGVQNDAEKGGEKEPEGGVPSSSSVSSASSSAAAAAASGGVVVKVEEECEGEDVKMTPASPDEKETEREKKNLASSPSSPLDDLEDSVGERVANSLQRLQLPLGRLGDSLSLLEDAGLKDAERAGARERAKKRAQVTQTLPTVAEEPTAKTAAEEPDEDRQGKEAEGRKTDHQAQLARRGMGISRGREQYGGGPHGAEFCGIIKALIQRAEMGNEGVHADLAVCEWMERKGMYKTAVAFAKAQNIEGLVDREFLHRIREVKSALARGETASAFEFCTLHRARLKKVSCLLEARLLFEVFLWTLHEKGPLAALEYSRKNVPPEAFGRLVLVG
uniref:CTLH domain-containing protein n=1 Tax=Chromera velia CCMP2878 TaxID=1169474 RepID=A0A0G4FHS0_9ALVE|eukprot:Cvel_17057.t1-p1 / transcript=Cvel_17057.t1 / gene=Cvel_17057 / organism=Chromera_velia_CCMP2878 / gene_product=Macrophage erythroblast attacher, putative / transcript_product=Macrophage erythroblast attacher, putative / location=Cvel_scaffold1344:855-5140(-) / protein_length=497 / sequence_SO=supercontig / SO=protein_coding / is_pseudo=false